MHAHDEIRWHLAEVPHVGITSTEQLHGLEHYAQHSFMHAGGDVLALTDAHTVLMVASERRYEGDHSVLHPPIPGPRNTTW